VLPPHANSLQQLERAIDVLGLRFEREAVHPVVLVTGAADLHAGCSHAAQLLDDCPCESGCPSCVGPIGEVGENGKQAARRILAKLLL